MARKLLISDTHCYACGRVRSKQLLGYDINTMKTYCLDPDRCPSPDRPDVELVPTKYESVIAAIRENYREDLALAFENLIGKTVSVRLTPAMIMHLLKTAQEYEQDTPTKTLEKIVADHMKDHPLDNVELTHCDWSAKLREKAARKPKKAVQKKEPESPIKEEPKNDDFEVDFEL